MRSSIVLPLILIFVGAARAANVAVLPRLSRGVYGFAHSADFAHITQYHPMIAGYPEAELVAAQLRGAAAIDFGERPMFVQKDGIFVALARPGAGIVMRRTFVTPLEGSRSKIVELDGAVSEKLRVLLNDWKIYDAHALLAAGYAAGLTAEEKRDSDDRLRAEHSAVLALRTDVALGGNRPFVRLRHFLDDLSRVAVPSMYRGLHKFEFVPARSPMSPHNRNASSSVRILIPSAGLARGGVLEFLGTEPGAQWTFRLVVDAEKQIIRLENAGIAAANQFKHIVYPALDPLAMIIARTVRAAQKALVREPTIDDIHAQFVEYLLISGANLIARHASSIQLGFNDLIAYERALEYRLFPDSLDGIPVRHSLQERAVLRDEGVPLDAVSAIRPR